MVAAEFWLEGLEDERPHRLAGWPRLLAAGLAGLLLGVTLTAFTGSRFAPIPSETRVVRTFPHPALDREWRGTPAPVDADRMFMRRR
jgi:hypothetical protein